MNLGTVRIAPQEGKDLPRRVQTNQDPSAREVQPDIAEAPQDGIFLSTGKSPDKTIKLSYVPQDPGMLAPKQYEVDAASVKDGLQGDRAKVSVPRHFPMPKPDADGNYLFRPEDPRFDCTQAFVATDRSLKMAEKYLGRSLPWGFSKELGRDQLLLRPHAGANVANAFYNSQAGSLNYFSFTDPKTGEIVRTGASFDVAAHETGHALLDALRHSYLGSLSVSAGGFHESFGDMTALLASLHDDAVIDQLQAETKGDLTKPNVVSRTAEQLGISISNMTNRPKTDALRQAINNHKYADQHFYPYYDKSDPNGKLGQEPHAYSNLFTGAFYDLFNAAYLEAAKDTSRTFKQNVTQARDLCGRLLFRGVEFAPVGDTSYREQALAMIKADAVDNGGKNRALLETVFKNRKILTAEDVAEHDKREAALPQLTLDPPSVQDEEDAKKFLETNRGALGVGEAELKFAGTHTNRRGETFLQYTFHRDIDLEGPDYGTLEGSRMRTNGGLQVVFDKEAKLLATYFDDVTPREVEDIKDHLKVAVAGGALSFDSGNIGSSHIDEHGMGYLNVAHVPGADGTVVQRSPIIWG